MTPTIKKLAHLLSAFDDFRGERREGEFLFRGQCETWKLKTTLERACAQLDADAPLARALKHEEYFLREFQRRAHHYLSDLPDPRRRLEWLALMRHHGAPTRMLDSTYSIRIATYFAIQHSQPVKNANAAVWVFDVDWLERETERRAFMAGHRADELRRPVSLENEAKKADILLSRDRPFRCVRNQNPFRLNERLTIQRGSFLVPGDVRVTFEENLNALPKPELHVKKLVIPRAAFPKISIELHGLDISEATLFPGIDGFARSLIAARRFIKDQRPKKTGVEPLR